MATVPTKVIHLIIFLAVSINADLCVDAIPSILKICRPSPINPIITYMDSTPPESKTAQRLIYDWVKLIGEKNTQGLVELYGDSSNPEFKNIEDQKADFYDDISLTKAVVIWDSIAISTNISLLRFYLISQGEIVTPYYKMIEINRMVFSDREPPDLRIFIDAPFRFQISPSLHSQSYDTMNIWCADTHDSLCVSIDPSYFSVNKSPFDSLDASVIRRSIQDSLSAYSIGNSIPYLFSKYVSSLQLYQDGKLEYIGRLIHQEKQIAFYAKGTEFHTIFIEKKGIGEYSTPVNCSQTIFCQVLSNRGVVSDVVNLVFKK